MNGNIAAIIEASRSKSFRALNAHLLNPAPAAHAIGTTTDVPKAGNRIRQAKVELNKTEQALRDYLEAQGIETDPHGLTFKLARGCKYTPDLVHTAPITGAITCYEAKGRHAWDDAIVKLKVVAARYVAIRFILADRDERGEWRQQKILT